MALTFSKIRASKAARTLAAVLATATLLGSVAACGSKANASDKLQKADGSSTTQITVGVCPGPYGDMVKEVLAPLLKDEGYELTTQEFTDYVQPNKALASGSIDANLFQHGNYLKKFTSDNNLDLTSLGQTPTLGLGIYSNTYKSISDIPDGATVSVSSDASNLARSLDVLRQVGLVELDGDTDATKATVDDITSNPKNLQIKTVDAAQLARSLDSVDFSLIPGNYAWDANLDPNSALALEDQTDGVMEVFVVRSSDVDTDFAKKVKDLLVSQKFKDAIANSRFSSFGKPAAWGDDASSDASSSSSDAASSDASSSSSSSASASATESASASEDKESSSSSK
ncbi:MAG: MetQ/NlpA family ABC transporter substrate-binding protein [Bifidobacteriaceae bacterium]|nr:MetQ/NlpA family ABC transporter substrate-binding protein [Bifidobacteriaceae bacterium]